jgi:ribosomal-protein-alanine N-acetyltransferase
MRREDVDAVAGIDREAFPTLWPPINYKNELSNRLAHYFVVIDGTVKPEPPAAETESEPSGLFGCFKQWWSRVTGNSPVPPGNEYLVGFIGMWLMVDEAHVINIAVRESYRQRGIGELMLIRIVDKSLELKASIVTLEVRASNESAKALYRKYGLNDVGLRRGYYSDNKEDAIIMSSDNLNTESFRNMFWDLKQKHCRKMGITLPW